MKQKEQNIAIAKACGWKNVKEYAVDLYEPLQLIGISPYSNIFLSVPDYVSDLNAMHEAEKLIMDESSITYFEHLNRISCPWHATAAQRAEAFLKTIGKWKE